MVVIKSLSKSREIERAWRQHDPWRQGRIPLAAREQLAASSNVS